MDSGNFVADLYPRDGVPAMVFPADTGKRKENGTDTGGFDWYALAASVIAFIGLQYFKWEMIPVILGSACVGCLWEFSLSWEIKY